MINGDEPFHRNHKNHKNHRSNGECSKPIDNPTLQSPFNLPRFVPISFHTNIQSVLKICESRETKA
jgi:hypothetical protein